MQAQIDTAFSKLNDSIFARQLQWFEGRNSAVREYYGSEERKAVMDAWSTRTRKDNEEVRANDKAKLENMAGGKAWLNAIWANPSEEDRKTFVQKNVKASIAKRDTQIIKALEKVGVTSIPDFELVEVSDGLEGTFYVADKKVSIRTIVAGGYNIQCLHNRTLVKVA